LRGRGAIGNNPAVDVPEQITRRSLVDATRESLMRIALAFGLLNAVVPLVTVLLTARTLANVVLALAWVASWLVAVFNADVVGQVLQRSASRLAFVAAGSALTTATILVTGGIDSPLANGANWLGWAATVAVQSRLRSSFGVAAILAVGPLAAFAIDLGPSALLHEQHRYAVVTGPLNPFVIVLVALCLAGVFQGVVKRMPHTLWEMRHGAAGMTTSGLRALLAGEQIGVPPAAPKSSRTGSGTGHTDATQRALTPDEQAIVDDLAEGLAPKEIALRRNTSDSAVYAGIRAAKRKVNAQTIEHLVALTWKPAT
jgi:DNA-binding CsgD family transcriptional regulator